jgi:hypothetical protein
VSVKYQITWPESLAQEMRTAADRLKIPLARFIREAMEDRLREWKVGKKRKAGPLDWMKGMAKGIKDTDLAFRIDEILYK